MRVPFILCASITAACTSPQDVRQEPVSVEIQKPAEQKQVRGLTETGSFELSLAPELYDETFVVPPINVRCGTGIGDSPALTVVGRATVILDVISTSFPMAIAYNPNDPTAVAFYSRGQDNELLRWSCAEVRQSKDGHHLIRLGQNAEGGFIGVVLEGERVKTVHHYRLPFSLATGFNFQAWKYERIPRAG